MKKIKKMKFKKTVDINYQILGKTTHLEKMRMNMKKKVKIKTKLIKYLMIILMTLVIN